MAWLARRCLDWRLNNFAAGDASNDLSRKPNLADRKRWDFSIGDVRTDRSSCHPEDPRNICVSQCYWKRVEVCRPPVILDLIGHDRKCREASPDWQYGIRYVGNISNIRESIGLERMWLAKDGSHPTESVRDRPNSDEPCRTYANSRKLRNTSTKMDIDCP